MEFLAPHFFYGLFALAIPVIIHLFNFRKTKRVYFSSTRFLQLINEQTSSRRTLKQYLILLSRLLFLFFLIMAFTQPYLPAEEGALQNSVQIYIDNSFSMTNEVDEDLPAFDQAIAYARKIIDLYPESTKFRLITNDPDPFSNRYRSAMEVTEKLTELEISRFSKTSSQVYEKFSHENASQFTNDNYYISDFQEKFHQPVETDTSFRIRLVPLSFTGTQNVFIDTLFLKEPLIKGSESSELIARLRNTSETEISNLITRVFVNNIQITSSSFNIPAQGYKDAVFNLAFSYDEQSRGVISFEDFPVTFDNEMYFVLSSGRKINVVEIRGEVNNSYISDVFANKDLYNFSSQEVNRPDYEALRSANLIVLNQLNELNNSLMFQLQEFLAKQGSIAIIPSYQSEPGNFRNLTGLQQLSSRDTSVFMAMNSPDFQNPFFQSVFEETTGNISMPSAKATWQWGINRNAILSFKNGYPFLSSVKNDKIFLFASPFDKEFTNFPLHAVFVPVLYKMAMSGVTESEPMYFSLDKSQFRLELDSVSGKDLLKLKKDDYELIPSQRASGNEVFIEIPEGDLQSGFYELTMNDETIKSLAFNFNKNESYLTQLNSEELTGLFTFAQTEIISSASENELETTLSQSYKAQELWFLALCLAISLIVVEILLIRFMK